MLTKEEVGLIETCQRDILRVIYGAGESYKNMLNKSGLDRMDNRRRRAVLKFCEKVKSDPRFDWFSQEKDDRLRPRAGAKAPKIRKNCTRRSPLHHFRRVVLGEKYGAEATCDEEGTEEDEGLGHTNEMESELALQVTGLLKAWYHPQTEHP